MEKILFGELNGAPVYEYVLKKGALTAGILDYGGIIRRLEVFGTDVVLGYRRIDDYVKSDGYLGALIGRVGNRVGKGEFTLGGKRYKVGINDGENSLHGGVVGFNAKIWKAEADGEKLVLSLFSPDGEEGYPANLNVTVTYEITDRNGLKITYRATSDGATPVNLTNHAYFDLAGEGSGGVLDTSLSIAADEITPVDSCLIPHGGFMAVSGSAFDFNSPKKIGRDIGACDEQLAFCGGYDINYVLRGEGFRKVAEARSEKSGIGMSVYTDAPGVQFYSGNFLTEREGKTGKYRKRYGFCLETQNFPNAVNCPEYPRAVIDAGEEYFTQTEYVFFK